MSNGVFLTCFRTNSLVEAEGGGFAITSIIDTSHGVLKSDMVLELLIRHEVVKSLDIYCITME